MANDFVILFNSFYLRTMQQFAGLKLMHKSSFLLLILVTVLLGSCKERNFELYVSPTGQPGNNGSVSSPVNSLETAIEIATSLRARDKKNNISIHILPGDYQLSKPLAISANLSGLSILGEGDNKVRIRGSVPLALNWEKHDDNIFKAKLQGDISFDQLIVNGKIQTLARYPNYDEGGGQWQGHAEDAISKERIKTWSNPSSGILHAMHNAEWGGFHYRIAGVDDNGDAILEGGTQNNRPAPPHPKYRMVENILEELDSPGEWYKDEEEQMLYYWPSKGIGVQSALFEAIRLESLITITGTPDQPAHNIHIEGIKFEYTTRTILKDYEPLLRSDWTIHRSGAIFLQGVRDCTVMNCEFVNLGGNAIFVSGFAKDIEISSNHIHECGASGICFVGLSEAVRSPSFQYKDYVPLVDMDQTPGPKSNAYPENCVASDNLIYRIGRLEKQTAGVQISMAMHIGVESNSIYDVPRAGINIGDGTWGGHVIEYNDVFNTVLESGDHGSFNSWGRDRFWHPNRKTMDSIALLNPQMPYWDAVHTTIIRNNRFRCDHGWDIDLDDGSSNYHIYNNLCLNGGIKLREGFFREVENNIMINNGFHPHVWFANSGDIFKFNIISRTHQNIRLDGWGKEIDFNLFTNQEDLLQAQAHGVDQNSAYGDPLFKNPSKLDYSVGSKSPAFDLGFRNFSMVNFGVKKDEFKRIAKRPSPSL